jgi:hypothetical protein
VTKRTDACVYSDLRCPRFITFGMFSICPAKGRAFRLRSETAQHAASRYLSDGGQTYANFPRYDAFAFRDGDAQEEGAVPAYASPAPGPLYPKTCQTIATAKMTSMA